jgi:hypothetical protein
MTMVGTPSSSGLASDAADRESGDDEDEGTLEAAAPVEPAAAHASSSELRLKLL